MKKKKILVIDDEEDFGFLMKHFFSRRNFDVYVAGNLVDGMRMLKEERPDILFLDNNLPDGLGWDKAEFISDNYPLTQLTLITASHFSEKVMSAFSILKKPFRWEMMGDLYNAKITV